MRASFLLGFMVPWVAACARAEPAVARLNPPDLYSSSRHVNVAVARGGRTIFVGGQAPVDREGRLVGRDEFGAQLEQTFHNLGRALAAAGAGFRDVVQLRTYLVSGPGLDMDAYRAAREKTFGGFAEKPTAVTVFVDGVTVDGAMIVVEAVAVVGD